MRHHDEAAESEWSGPTDQCDGWFDLVYYDEQDFEKLPKDIILMKETLKFWSTFVNITV